jgi:hypothetical protein
VERSLYFVVAFAFAFAFAFVFALLLSLQVLLLVLRRHSERSEESPHFRGERSDPSAFSLPSTPMNRHFDRSRVPHPSQSHREGWGIRAKREPSSSPCHTP